MARNDSEITVNAIALLEIADIAGGIDAMDFMVKQSPISLLKSGIVSGGKFLVLIGGSVAAVDEAWRAGQKRAGRALLDTLLLADVHRQVYEALQGKTVEADSEALGIFEADTIATTILAADAALKGATVSLPRLHTGDGYHGRGFAFFNGAIEDVQIAMDIAGGIADEANQVFSCRIIPRMHQHTIAQLSGSLVFQERTPQQLKDGEI